MRKLKRETHTKSLILTLTPTQWLKLRHISRKNRKSINAQLRSLIDYAINLYEKNMGVIEISDTEPDPPKQ